MVLKRYKEDPQNFTAQYQRTTSPRLISPEIEQNILKDLSIKKKIIQDKEIPLRSYNYHYIQQRLKEKYLQKVFLPTIINRAKRHGFNLRKPKKSIHDREVLTNSAGEFIPHDTSYHLWAPASKREMVSHPLPG